MTGPVRTPKFIYGNRSRNTLWHGPTAITIICERAAKCCGTRANSLARDYFGFSLRIARARKIRGGAEAPPLVTCRCKQQSYCFFSSCGLFCCGRACGAGCGRACGAGLASCCGRCCGAGLASCCGRCCGAGLASCCGRCCGAGRVSCCGRCCGAGRVWVGGRFAGCAGRVLTAGRAGMTGAMGLLSRMGWAAATKMP